MFCWFVEVFFSRLPDKVSSTTRRSVASVCSNLFASGLAMHMSNFFRGTNGLVSGKSKMVHTLLCRGPTSFDRGRGLCCTLLQSFQNGFMPRWC